MQRILQWILQRIFCCNYVRFRKKIVVAMLLRIYNGIAIELQQHILQRLIVVANLLQSCNGIATEIAMVSNETVANLLQICYGIAIELQQNNLQRLIVVAKSVAKLQRNG